MRNVVVNSTPIITLANSDCIEILKSVYDEINIPVAVMKEISAKEDSVCSKILQNSSWIKIVQCPDFNRKIYPAYLHDGEIEVMELAKHLKSDLLIIDDNVAKKFAKSFGFKITGTLGVLLKAKRMGILREIRPLIKTVQENNFYLSNRIVEEVLKLAGEYFTCKKNG